MPNKSRWANSPIIVVPLSAFALGLAFVPFAVGTSDHAAQFYGSFLAALIAAGAVVGNAFLQAKLSREQRSADRREEMLAEALELYAWLNNLQSEIEFISIVLRRLLEQNPRTTITAEEFRTNGTIDTRNRLRNRLVIASRLPPPFGHDIVNLLHKVDGILDTILFVPMLSKDTKLEVAQLGDRQIFADYYSKLTSWHRAKLGQYLVQHNVIDMLDGKASAAIDAGRPVYVAAGGGTALTSAAGH